MQAAIDLGPELVGGLYWRWAAVLLVEAAVAKGHLGCLRTPCRAAKDQETMRDTPAPPANHTLMADHHSQDQTVSTLVLSPPNSSAA